MESVESRTIDDSRLMADQHAFAIFERIDNNGSSVPKLDLKDRTIVLAPPLLANRGMVRTKSEEMSRYWKRGGDFEDAFDMRDIGCSADLGQVSRYQEIEEGEKRTCHIPHRIAMTVRPMRPF